LGPMSRVDDGGLVVREADAGVVPGGAHRVDPGESGPAQVADDVPDVRDPRLSDSSATGAKVEPVVRDPGPPAPAGVVEAPKLGGEPHARADANTPAEAGPVVAPADAHPGDVSRVDTADTPGVGSHADSDAAQPGHAPSDGVPDSGASVVGELGTRGHVAASDPVRYPRPVVDDPARVHTVAGSEVATNEVFAARKGLDPNSVYYVEGRGEYYTNAQGKVTYVKTTWADDASRPNPDLMDAQPGTTYVVTPRITNPVEGLNYDQVFIVSDNKLTVTFFTEHLAPGYAPRNSTIQAVAGGSVKGYEAGHSAANLYGGGYEFINNTQQWWQANRGAGPLSLKNQDEFFRVMSEADPTAIENIQMTIRFPDGAVPTPTTYTPKGGETYVGSVGPRPDSYTISWWENGVPQRPRTIPNDEAGWLNATRELKEMRGQ